MAEKFVKDPGRVREMASGIISGSVDPVELVESYFDRIDAVEDSVHAWATPDREGALTQARARALEAKDGHIRGALHGVPMAVKDVIDVAGLPTRAYSPTRATIGPALADAQIVASFREAGVVFLGKTHTTEFAFYERVPPTCNPHDLTRTPGGSSAGSAAAVASGMTPLALGTQTAGSVTRPAAFCGIGGFKPSKLAWSATGVIPFSPAFDTVGTFGYTVTDAVAAFEAVSTTFLLRTKSSPERPNLVLISEANLEAADAAAVDAVERQAEKWAAAGWALRRAESPVTFTDVQAQHTLVTEYEVGRAHPHLADLPEDDVSQRLRDAIVKGLSISLDDYVAARSVLRGMSDQFWSTFGPDDVLLFPTALGPAPLSGTTGDPRMIVPFTALGGPVSNMPVGMEGGMPLGILLAGAPGFDRALGKWSCDLEAATG
jgi:aspartyl-tRNA(Asn)/glutamyl-tRNA(Gln) amidotransferase subunit A